ncbi:MAG: acetylxylan esterase, partial [Mariniphaga sp.]|nr:acetylxylan esterase [Mariniphaga sp.]
PKGEYLSGYLATPVYKLFRLEGLIDPIQPPLNTPFMSNIGYHIREGVHDVTRFDWFQFIKFADKHLK